MKHTATFDYRGSTFIATGIWDRGFAGSRDEPPEPSGWEIESIAFQLHPTVNFADFAEGDLLDAATDALDVVQAIDEDAKMDARAEYEDRRREAQKLGEDV